MTDVLTEGKIKGALKGGEDGVKPTKPPPARLSKKQILAKAEVMARQHQQDIINTREAFIKDAIDKGYNLKEWTVCDNLLDIKAGLTYEYRVWLAKNNPTGEQNNG